MDKMMIESEIATAFLRLWDGYEKRHIELNAQGVTKDAKGKVLTKVATVEGVLTPQLAAAHLAGEASIGVAPVKADSTCSWGVLDVDWYDMPEDDVRALASRLRTRAAAFRTKSRGLHIYVFTSEPIPAREMHDYLVALRKRLPKKAREKTELFPKETQVVVTQDSEPTAVNLPLRGSQRELAWIVDGTQITKFSLDETGKLEILKHIDDHCRVDAATVRQIVAEKPTLDSSEIGYKVPDNPAGRNDLLMRIAASMQARGWPDTEMDAEIRRLNGDANFHPLFADGPLTEVEIVNLLKNAKRKEKGIPTPLHYRVVEKFNRRWSKITINGTVEYIDKNAAEFTTFTKQMLFDETSDQVIREL